MDEASELIVDSRRLEETSQELEAATRELRAANEQLKELDKLKDDFVTTVSHELRTPLTSIRAFSEIVHDHPDLPIEERRKFLQIIVQESERLTLRLNDILAEMEAGKIEWHMADMHRPRHQVTVLRPRPRMTEEGTAARWTRVEFNERGTRP